MNSGAQDGARTGHKRQATCPGCFSKSAQFERWSHFKDYGLPGVKHDPLNQAAIADGSCRLVEPPLELDGDSFWTQRARVSAVLAALAEAPPTDKPSHFVRATNALLRRPCSTPTPALPANFTLGERKAALQNWYHALCAPEADSSWAGQYDPAEQPQQAALTAGFACIVACGASGGKLGGKAISSLSTGAQAARKALCAALPWGTVDFSTAATEAELGRMASPVLSKPCGCALTGVGL
mmetsp:Transcript_19283/g.56575  ORF Transcript_19283/g.56575 Transcript_19283/m.56575 type:complete len:239 (-) Transcript_19283:17-733(-)